MAITYFRISQLPVRVTMEKDSIAVVLNQSYLIAEENEVDFNNASGFKAEGIDLFKFQVSEDDIEWSNEGIVELNDLADTNTPASANATETIVLESQNTNLYTPSNRFPINSSTDRILLTGFTTGNGILKLNGTQIFVGEIIKSFDIPNLVFDNLLGGGEPFNKIQYKCGNHLGFDATVYEVTIDVDILSQVEFQERTVGYTNRVEATVNYAVTEYIDRLKVKLGYINKIAGGQIVLASPMLSLNAFNKFEVNEVEKTADETFDFDETVDQNGEIEIFLRHYHLDTTGVASTSVATYTLQDMDTDAAKVDSGNDDYVSSVTIVGMANGAVGPVTSYRSSFEASDGYVYGAYLDNTTPVVKRIVSGVVETASGVTDLETDWTNRLSLTYS